MIWIKFNQKDTCLEIWGDGIKFNTNSTYWDDGNKISGDGCSLTCDFESGWTWNEGSNTIRDLWKEIWGDGIKFNTISTYWDDGNIEFKYQNLLSHSICPTSSRKHFSKNSSPPNSNFRTSNESRSTRSLTETLTSTRSWATELQTDSCCFEWTAVRDWSRSEGVMADRKTARLIEFEESDWLDLKTFYNTLSFKQRLYKNIQENLLFYIILI